MLGCLYRQLPSHVSRSGGVINQHGTRLHASEGTIAPQHHATQVIVISGQGMRKLQLPAGQLSDLAGRLAKFRGRPLSFQSSRDGRLEMLVLDEVVTASPLAP